MSLEIDPKKLMVLLPELSHQQLQDLLLQQAALIQQLQSKVVALEAELATLRQQPPRSTAPFRLPPEKRSKNPQKPGQKKGHRGYFRRPPTPTEQFEVPLDYCPDCWVPIPRQRHHRQILEELPVVVPQVIEITTHSGICPKCRKRVRSSHPLQISRATGAASTMLGPRAAAVAGVLQHRFHLTKNKTCALLQELFGLSLTRGGLVALSHRLARKLRPHYAALRRAVQQARHLHADETGWYVGQVGASLCVFTNPDLTLYHITQSRTRDMVQTILGNFQGVLISDCLNIYDGVNERQQKCYAHHLRAIKAGLTQAPASPYLPQVQHLLQTAMALKALHSEGAVAEFPARLARLEAWAAELLQVEKRPEPLQPAEEAVRQRLAKQRDHLFEFLRHREVPATNNQAERQLRPAVIARKVSCGNRTEKGARTWEVLASLAVTAAQRKESFYDLLQRSLYALPP